MFSHVKVFGLAAVALLALAKAATIGPVGEMVVSNKVIRPDGFSRSSVLAGGEFPGPLIIGKKGDQFKLNVVNSLTDGTMHRSTSIHWHGIFQNGTNWADGAAWVTQCPIVPDNAFLYDFPVYQQAGTFWYHSHFSTQYCDGLRGAFVVYDPQDPYISMYDVDDESTVITLADWYHDPAPEHTGVIPPTANTTLINGKGRHVGGPPVDLAIINVVRGKKYRLRIVSMSCDPAFTFAIDKHTLTIIEADGEYTAPLVVDSFVIYAGQRYSAILNANQAPGNYWIRANPDIRGLPGYDNGRNSAILRYQGAPVVDPTTQFVSTRPLKETNLRALIHPTPPGRPEVGGADVNINIPHRFNGQTFRYEIGGHAWENPTVPVLLQILSQAQQPQDLLPEGSVYELPPNKIIEISLPGTGPEVGGPHPFHLHGHSFWVVRSGDSTTYNYNNPVRRDTVNTGGNDGNATIRFVTDNSGPWFLHCHIDWHLELGLAVVMAEDRQGTPAHVNPSKPPAWDQLCPIYEEENPDRDLQAQIDGTYNSFQAGRGQVGR
ncbi:putative multicopper oxidase family protein [Lyophyllum shimeji]|uniref:Multicopper oxidase family protein n=1 Tax=Lyophyllum shimeji TaxID=47721 RepID=A0A9P3PSU4_LYOSH|nr:putative multicopper oxidase family protein [Lyophyllum shimeji]